MKQTLLLLPLLACVLFANAQSFDAAKADSLLARLNRHHKGMGAVAIYKNGKPVYEQGFGYAVTEKDIPNTPATVFKIGSVSKVFTAVLIFQLIDENKLKLDTRLADFFPEIANAAKITIGQMLNHQSGLHNYTEDTAFTAWSQEKHEPAELLARLQKEPSDFEPGTKSEYSNTNYLLLGYIIEKITGQDYCEVLRRKITQPLGMSLTGCSWPAAAKTAETRGYSWDGQKWEAAFNTPFYISAGAGGIWSSMPDLNTFITALMQGKLLSEASLKQMMTRKRDFGFGLLRIPFYEHYAYGHNGFIDNFSTSMAYFPKDSLSVAVSLNATNTNFNDLLVGLLSVYFNKPYDLPEFEKEITLPEATLKKYVGVYHSAAIGMDITVSLEGTQLMAQATGQGAFPLSAQTETNFSFDAAGVVIDFQKIENGQAQILMLHQGGGNIPFERKK